MNEATIAIMRLGSMVHPIGAFAGHESVSNVKNPKLLRKIAETLSVEGQNDGELFAGIVEALQTSKTALELFNEIPG